MLWQRQIQRYTSFWESSDAPYSPLENPPAISRSDLNLTARQIVRGLDEFLAFNTEQQAKARHPGVLRVLPTT